MISGDTEYEMVPNALRILHRNEGIIPLRFSKGIFKFVMFTGPRKIWTSEKALDLIRSILDLELQVNPKALQRIQYVKMKSRIFESEKEARRYVNRKRKAVTTIQTMYKLPKALQNPGYTRHLKRRATGAITTLKKTKGDQEEKEIPPTETESIRKKKDIQLEFLSRFMIGKSYHMHELINRRVAADRGSFLKLEGIGFLAYMASRAQQARMMLQPETRIVAGPEPIQRGWNLVETPFTPTSFLQEDAPLLSDIERMLERDTGFNEQDIANIMGTEGGTGDVLSIDPAIAMAWIEEQQGAQRVPSMVVQGISEGYPSTGQEDPSAIGVTMDEGAREGEKGEGGISESQEWGDIPDTESESQGL